MAMSPAAKISLSVSVCRVSVTRIKPPSSRARPVSRSHSGPPGFFDEPNYNLEVSPNPFIPPEEEYIDLDGDGELDWNDYDQDGIPDGWPPEADTDGDGLPDVPPPDPFVSLTA